MSFTSIFHHVKQTLSLSLFTDDETEAERLSNLSKFGQLVSDGAKIQLGHLTPKLS